MNDSQRNDLRYLAGVLINHRRQLDYPRNDVRGSLDAATFRLSRERALDGLTKGARLMFDCSGAVTCLYKWAGLQDPNGLDYSHEGYTGTMLAHLTRHYWNPFYAMPGALVIFGPGTGEHVAMVIEHGHDPLLFSHGYEQGTGPIRLSEERKYHKPPVTFLNVSQLGS